MSALPLKARRRAARGFSLLELLVATTIGIIATAAIATGFIGMNRLMYTQEGIRAGQASLRQSFSLVNRQLRNAGYGVEPWYTFDFPSGWSDDPARNRSDRLVFRSRDPLFGKRVQQGTASATSVRLTAPLGVPLKQGQIVQLVCPGAVKWTYAQLASDAADTDTLLNFLPPTGAFPRLNGEIANVACFNGSGNESAALFKIDTYDYGIELIDDDGVAQTPAQPFLFRHHGLGNDGALGEPIADNLEALRVVFLRKDATGQLVPFTPNPVSPRPAYDSAKDAPERFSDHPANTVAVRVGFVARSGVVDQEARTAKRESTLPAFAGRPNLTVPAGYRRVLFETTVPLRNLRSVGMFLPPYTSDGATTDVCRGQAPVDGLNCFSG
jgi:type IV pilus assembly protein PilW